MNKTSLRIGGLLLAAGKSERFGGENKLLAKLNDEPIIKHAARAMQKSALDEIAVVLGYEATNIQATLEELEGDLRFITNPDYSKGQSSSLKLGVKHFSDKVDALMVVLGDMPLISAEIINRLIASHKSGAITLPMAEGRRGNPVIWSAEFFAEFETLEGDNGGRMLFDLHKDKLNPIPINDPAVLLDADTPADLTELNTHYS